MKKKKDKDTIYKILEHLYFVEGLEDIRCLYWKNKKSLEKWCEKNGERICQIVFALIFYENPDYIWKVLNQEQKGRRDKN